MSKQYKIGEFSRYMGVTPDFLKHYEQYDLIPPAISENGYRYYSFEMASETLECIKLRNWDFSVKEIQTIINTMNLGEIRALYAQKRTEIEHKLHFYQELLEDQAATERWFNEKLGPQDWTIERIEPQYFLPHSNNRDFLYDERLYSIMEQWMPWMPMVRSCQHLFDFEKGKTQFHWGFLVSEKIVHKHQLPCEKPCIHLHSQRCLIVPLTRYTQMKPAGQTDCVGLVCDILRQHGLQSKGDIYREVYQYSHENQRRQQHCRLIVPLSETKND